ncbi:accessory Sec system protein Asp2, partial [Streptococcus gordonii]|nr:accessory Sec system protein Asp2 [Streptococcus gordonii]
HSQLAIKKVMEMEKINHFSAIIVDDLDLIPDLFLIESRIIPYTIFYFSIPSLYNTYINDIIIL